MTTRRPAVARTLAPRRFAAVAALVPMATIATSAATWSLILGLLMALVVGPRFPPAADGAYFDQLARRIAAGAGYTWLWPDGTVTPVAHYPVGFSALEAVGYRLLGNGPAFARVVVACTGAAAVLAATRLLAPFGKRGATAGAWLLALHPALVLYIPAMMTEGLVASLLVVAAALVQAAANAQAQSKKARHVLLLGVLGVLFAAGTYLRPQNLLLAPLFGAVAGHGGRSGPSRRTGTTGVLGGLAGPFASGAIVLACTLACLLPWTARNCARMHSCALVSVNGGWNLLIGAETSTGAWQPLETPAECVTVWDEAAKDACFGRAARREIAAAPAAFLARVPAKWAVTFDYFGAAPFYLHASAPSVVSVEGKERLGAVETVASRVLLLGALLALGRAASSGATGSSGSTRTRRLLPLALALVGMAFACLVHAWPAYLVVGVLAAARARHASAERAVAYACAALVTLATLAIHAVFFGAGRYGLPVAAFIPVLAATIFAPPRATDVAGDALVP